MLSHLADSTHVAPSRILGRVYFIGTRGGKVLTFPTQPLDYRKVDVDDEATSNRQGSYRLPPASMLWKEGATVVALRPTATIEFKVHLRPHLLAANLVYDIPVEIM
ncbi:MAG: hypothetical protein ACI9R3_006211 [Verrucomicrobiales bacterium]